MTPIGDAIRAASFIALYVGLIGVSIAVGELYGPPGTDVAVAVSLTMLAMIILTDRRSATASDSLPDDGS